MPTWETPPSAENLIVGKGTVYFNRFDANGVGTGLRHLGNVDALEITTEDDVLEKFSNMTPDAPLYKKITRRRTVNFAMALSEFHPQNMALALMGDVDETYAQAATAVVGEVLTASAVLGAYYKFAKFGPHTAITITGTTSGAATVDVDYRVVNANLGLIQILETGGMTAGEEVTASYTPTAYTAGEVPRIKGGTQNTVEGSLLFVGDPTAGPRMMVEVWKVSITPDGGLGLISEEFADMGLTGGVLADPVGRPGNQLFQVTYLPA